MRALPVRGQGFSHLFLFEFHEPSFSPFRGQWAIWKGGRVTTNLEYYRKQAKALLKAAKSGDSSAQERIRRYSPEHLALNAAQLTLAREQGFASWTRFKQYILQSRL